MKKTAIMMILIAFGCFAQNQTNSLSPTEEYTRLKKLADQSWTASFDTIKQARVQLTELNLRCKLLRQHYETNSSMDSYENVWGKNCTTAKLYEQILQDLRFIIKYQEDNTSLQQAADQTRIIKESTSITD